MSIEIRNVSKNFNAFKALDDINLDIQSGELVALLALRVRQDHPAADHRRWKPRTPATSCSMARTFAARRATATRRFVPALRAVPPHDGVRQRRFGAHEGASGRASPRSGAKVHELLNMVQRSTGSPTAIPSSSPVASGSVSPWPARWRWSRRSCSSTNPSAPSTPRCAELRRWLARLHEINLTSVFVTRPKRRWKWPTASW